MAALSAAAVRATAGGAAGSLTRCTHAAPLPGTARWPANALWSCYAGSHRRHRHLLAAANGSAGEDAPPGTSSRSSSSSGSGPPSPVGVGLSKEATEQPQSSSSPEGGTALLTSWWREARATFPEVPWGPSDLARVMGTSLAAAAAFAAVSAALPQAVPGDGPQSEALRHLAREGALATLMPAAVLLSLARFRPWERGLLQARWEPEWIGRTLLVCAVVFPLADPVLYRAWAPLAQAIYGPPPPIPVVAEVQAAAAAGDWGSLSAHIAASGLVGPIWEEVFFRGFFLASLVKVLPLPACVAASSLNFAVLHLSPPNFASLLLLSAACDALYLRTHNLLPPLLLHCLWNTGQLVAIAFLGKQEFV